MKVSTPWTAKQVAALNRWQAAGTVHPFTCGNDRSDEAHTRYADAMHIDNGQLVATADGWRCPACNNYRQNWAHDFMFEDPPKPLSGGVTEEDGTS